MRAIIYFCLIIGVGITGYYLYDLKTEVEKMEDFNNLWILKIENKRLIIESGVLNE